MVVGRGRGQGNESLAGGLRGERASDQVHGNSLPLLCPHALPLSRAADWLWFDGWTGCENTDKGWGSGRVHHLQYGRQHAGLRCPGGWTNCLLALVGLVGPIVCRSLPALLDSGGEREGGCLVVSLDQSDQNSDRREPLGALVPSRTKAFRGC